MIVVFLGSSRGVRSLNNDNSFPVHLTKIPKKELTILDWSINELSKSNIKDIYFVGGYHVEKVIQKTKNIKIIHNPDWKNILTLNILKKINFKNKNLLVINSNVLFRSEFINYLKKLKNQNQFFYDLKNPKINNSLFYFNNKTSSKIYNFLSKKRLPIDFISLVSFLKKKYNFNFIQNKNLNFYNDKSSLAKFVLSSKAQSLSRLRPMLKKSIILDQISISYSDWKIKKNFYLTNISDKFKNSKIVVRSSGVGEDSWNQSMAGHFISYLNVDANNNTDVNNKIQKVFNSFALNKNIQGTNQVLIQKFIDHTTISGVIFTTTNDNGSPYYTLNYDDFSGLTDTVTSGAVGNTKTLYIYKDQKIKFNIPWINKLLSSIIEIENKILFTNLDIEFAIRKNKIYILQVRPLIIKDPYNFDNVNEFKNELLSLSNFIDESHQNKNNLHGNKTVFSNMSDWNPAEMIGTHPKPLSTSLYEKLITDSSWLKARVNLGYKDIGIQRLLIKLSGMPYVDIRKSFNSFLIPNLSNSLSEELVNKEINFLIKNPNYFDKVEFKVVVNCYYFDKLHLLNHLTKNLKVSKKNSLIIVRQYKNWTKRLLNNSHQVNKDLNKSYELMNTKIDKISFSLNNSLGELSEILNDTIEMAKKFGVIPFSTHARYGFVAMSILNTFVRNNILSIDDYNVFLKNIPTISSDFNSDLIYLHDKKISKSKFLKKYGHLRPSSYDITSKNYKELFEINFFSKKDNKIKKNKISKNISQIIWNKNVKHIQKFLKKDNFNISQSNLFSFIFYGIQGREKGKYEFTKCLDLIFQIVKIIGKKINLSDDKIQFSNINDFTKFSAENINDLTFFKRSLNYKKKKYEFSSMVKLPPLVTNSKQIYYVEHFNSIPNFITSKSIEKSIVVISDLKNIPDVKNKIVLIESADPGYDWLFSFDISGLITKYGGSASHMAIRSAEYGLPSAIGCGDKIFNELANANTILLDCNSKIIKILT